MTASSAQSRPRRPAFLGPLIGLGLLAFAWWAFGTLLIPAIISEAYRGEGIGLVRDWLEAQPSRPLERYLDFWARTHAALLIALLMFGSLGLLLGRPEFHRWWDIRVGPVASFRPDLSRARMVAVHVLILGLLGGSLLSMAVFRDIWPFSPYKMFSYTGRFERGLTTHIFYGVPEEGDGSRIELSLDVFRPLLANAVRNAVKRAEDAADPERARRATAVALLAFYESQRLRGDHTGPRLRELVIIENHWPSVDAFASGVPDRHELLVSVRLRE